jgi:hypothetical protein
MDDNYDKFWCDVAITILDKKIVKLRLPLKDYTIIYNSND